jgi:hypothetical protein
LEVFDVSGVGWRVKAGKSFSGSGLMREEPSGGGTRAGELFPGCGEVGEVPTLALSANRVVLVGDPNGTGSRAV